MRACARGGAVDLCASTSTVNINRSDKDVGINRLCSVRDETWWGAMQLNGATAQREHYRMQSCEQLRLVDKQKYFSVGNSQGRVVQYPKHLGKQPQCDLNSKQKWSKREPESRL